MLALFQVHPLLPSNGEESTHTPAVIKLHLRQQAHSHHSIISNVILIHRTGRALLLLLLLSVPDTFHSSNDATTVLISRFFWFDYSPSTYPFDFSFEWSYTNNVDGTNNDISTDFDISSCNPDNVLQTTTDSTSIIPSLLRSVSVA